MSTDALLRPGLAAAGPRRALVPVGPIVALVCALLARERRTQARVEHASRHEVRTRTLSSEQVRTDAAVSCSDGWTLELLTADLRDLCFDLSPPERPSFGNVAGWWLSESEPPQDTVDFWRGYLDGTRPLGWPSQNPLDGDMLATTGAAILHWSGELDALSQKHGITPAIASRLAILVALHHHAGSSDVNVGIVRSGRDIDVVDADEIIGPCVSVLPSRVRFDSPSASLLSLACAEAEADRRARLHQHVTLSQLASVCDLPGGRADLFDILVTFQSLAERDPSFEAAAPWPIRQPPERIHMPTNYTLSFEVTPEKDDKDRLELACFFDERIIDKSEVEGVLKSVATVLDYLTTAPCTAVAGVKLVDDAAGDLARAKRGATSKAAAAGSAPVNGGGSALAELDAETSAIVERLKPEWSAVLRVHGDEIGAHDSFSSLGGDSVRRSSPFCARLDSTALTQCYSHRSRRCASPCGSRRSGWGCRRRRSPGCQRSHSRQVGCARG